MEHNYRQLLLALILGLFLPRLVLGTATLGFSAPQIPDSTQSPSEVPTDPETAAPITVTVIKGDKLSTVMELEAYIRGVVLAEMPASFHGEALKAQAIVARTYALKRQEQGLFHPEGGVCTDSACCQSYVSDEEYLALGWGDKAAVEKVRQAVEDTRGQVLLYEGQLIEATYFSCSGGRTEDAVAVWGTDVPYLQAVDSPGEEGSEKYRSQLTFTPGQFAAALGRSLSGTPEQWLGKVQHTQGGGVQTMYIAGLCYTGTQLRQLLGLRSTLFTMEAKNGSILISMRGQGHRVGMSQYGADAMAETGKTAEEILSHYYRGTLIDKIPSVE